MAIQSQAQRCRGSCWTEKWAIHENGHVIFNSLCKVWAGDKKLKENENAGVKKAAYASFMLTMLMFLVVAYKVYIARKSAVQIFAQECLSVRWPWLKTAQRKCSCGFPVHHALITVAGLLVIRNRAPKKVAHATLSIIMRIRLKIAAELKKCSCEIPAPHADVPVRTLKSQHSKQRSCRYRALRARSPVKKKKKC